MKKMVRKELGQVLLAGKFIAPAQLEEALRFQKEKGGLIGEILVLLGFTTEEVIARALTTQYGFPYLPLSNYEMDSQLALLIPEHVAKQFYLVPVDRIGDVITVAMSNPLNTQAIEDIEMITHLKVEVFVSTASDVREAIERCYRA